MLCLSETEGVECRTEMDTEAHVLWDNKERKEIQGTMHFCRICGNKVFEKTKTWADFVLNRNRGD